MQAFKKYEVLTRKRDAELLRERETKRLEFLDDENKLAQEIVAIEEPEIHIQDELPVTLPPSVNEPHPSPSSPYSISAASSSSAPNSTTKDQRKDAPVLSKEKVDDWEKISDIFNGGEMKNYKWSQSITDIDVRISVPKGTTAKDVVVDIRSGHLKVELQKPKTVNEASVGNGRQM